MVHYRKSLIAIFQDIFASINKIFILAGRPGTSIVQTLLFLKGGGGVKFDYLPWTEGESEKLKKRGWKYSAGVGLFKRGDRHFSIFKGLSFLHLEITLPFAKLCYVFEENLFFSVTIILWKKGLLKLSKNEPENIP